MKKSWIVVAFAMVLFASCGHKEKVKKPDPLLTQQQMVDILTDAYLIEADLNRRKSIGEDVGALQHVYYDQVFEHYGINDTIFDANMHYYTYEVPTLEHIMDSVMNRFAKAQRK